jgi:hypothetical protein
MFSRAMPSSGWTRPASFMAFAGAFRSAADSAVAAATGTDPSNDRLEILRILCSCFKLASLNAKVAYWPEPAPGATAPSRKADFRRCRFLAPRYTGIANMTNDERLEKLTERHEALTQTVELLSRDIQKLLETSQQDGENIQKLLETSQQDGENIRALARIAEIHERRLSGLEEGQ